MEINFLLQSTSPIYNLSTSSSSHISAAAALDFFH